MAESALSFPPELLLRAQGGGLGLRAAIFDVDGVLTDGRLFIGEAGEVFKAFHVLDGHGLKLLARVGIAPIVITGRDSPAVRRRMADLGLADAHYGVADKLALAHQCPCRGEGAGPPCHHRPRRRGRGPRVL